MSHTSLSIAQNSITIDHWTFNNTTLDTAFSTTYNIYNNDSPCKAYQIETQFEYVDYGSSDCIVIPTKKCCETSENSFTIYSFADSNLSLSDSLHVALRQQWDESFDQQYTTPREKTYAIEGSLNCLYCGFLTNDSIQIPTQSVFLPGKQITYLAFDSLFWVIELTNSQGGAGNVELIFNHMSYLYRDSNYTFKFVESELLEVDAFLKFE